MILGKATWDFGTMEGNGGPGEFKGVMSNVERTLVIPILSNCSATGKVQKSRGGEGTESCMLKKNEGDYQKAEKEEKVKNATRESHMGLD